MTKRWREELLSAEEAARQLAADPRQVRKWITAGKLPARRVGREWIVTARDLADFTRPPRRQRKEGRAE